MRRKKRKQTKLIIISTLSIIFLMSVGYAAFETNLNITAKGNIKEVYHTVKFKTQLLENNKFENELEGWEKYGSSYSKIELDPDLKFENQNTVKLTEEQNDGNSYAWNGIFQKINIDYDENKKYEISVYVYKDATINNEYRTYISFFDGNTTRFMNWTSSENSITTNGGASINFSNEKLPLKTWSLVKGIGTAKHQPIGHIHFRIDTNATIQTDQQSVIWIANPNFYEYEEKEIKKYSKVGNLPTAEKEGYTFVGWFTKEDGGDQIDENKIIKDDTEYFARFTKD